MTAHARQVLDDARAALSAHDANLSGPAFRVSWFAIVALLRAIGHVLAKVDAASSPALAAAISTAWSKLSASKPEPAIFWQFIEVERNRYLKNYEHGITRFRIYRTGSASQVLALDLANASAKAVQLVSAFNVPTEVPDRGVISVLSSGSFEGRPEVEVAQEAIAWWEQYLTDIERQVKPDAEA